MSGDGVEVALHGRGDALAEYFRRAERQIELLAREAVARITSPNYWSFIDHVLHEDDVWDARVMDEIVAVVGDETPVSMRLDIDQTHAPAASRWLRANQLTIGDLLRDPVLLLMGAAQMWRAGLPAQIGRYDEGLLSTRDDIDLCLRLHAAGWPSGMRVTVRGERPHPGAQLTLSDIAGRRGTAEWLVRRALAHVAAV